MIVNELPMFTCVLKMPLIFYARGKNTRWAPFFIKLRFLVKLIGFRKSLTMGAENFQLHRFTLKLPLL